MDYLDTSHYTTVYVYCKITVNCHIPVTIVMINRVSTKQHLLYLSV